jgi:predicted enzyme related to lactoylglutathione lyase
VPNLDDAIEFYRNKIGLELVWRRGSSEAGLEMGNSDTELVVVAEPLKESEVDILVDSADKVAEHFERLGGKIDVAPFDIAIGRCAVVRDPWGNRFVILDMSKGALKTDDDRNVI